MNHVRKLITKKSKESIKGKVLREIFEDFVDLPYRYKNDLNEALNLAIDVTKERLINEVEKWGTRWLRVKHRNNFAKKLEKLRELE